MIKTLLYEGARQFVRLGCRLRLEVELVCQAQLAPGPKIFVPNHPTTLDPILIAAHIEEPIHFMVTGGAFDVAVLNRFLRATGQIPVHRDRPQLAMDQAIEMLEAGQNVGVCIEGALSPLEGGFGPPRTGPVRLALASGAPLVPVGVHVPMHTRHVVNGKVNRIAATGVFLHPGVYCMTVGSPLRFEGDVSDRALVRQLTGRLMERVIALSVHSGDWLASRQRTLSTQRSSPQPAVGAEPWR